MIKMKKIWNRIGLISSKLEQEKTISWELTPEENSLSYYHYYVRIPVGLLASEKQTTNVIPLEMDSEIIFSNFNKEARYEINRAETRDQYDYEMINHPTKKDLESFLNSFRDFYIQKSLDVSSVDSFYAKELEERRRSNKLFISKIWSNEGIDIRHVYTIETHGRIRLTCSSSAYREFDLETKQKNGRLNRLLHWKDILFFKDMDFEFYDLGGVSISNNPSLAKFKLSFSRIIDTQYFAYPYNEIDRKKILLLNRKSSAQYREIAFNVINQLSAEYYFDYEENTKSDYFPDEKYDGIIDLEKITFSYYGFDPKYHFYSKKRTGKLSYAGNFTDSQLREITLQLPENISISQFVSQMTNSKWNELDICFFIVNSPVIMSQVIECVSAGCFPIIILDSFDVEIDFIDSLQNGIIIQNGYEMHRIIDTIKWCENKKKYIRQNEKKRADDMFDIYRWEKIKENWIKEIEECCCEFTPTI